MKETGGPIWAHNRHAARDHAATPLTPSWAFEEDIYKRVVWQRGEPRLFYLPDLSRVAERAGLTGRGLTKTVPLQSAATSLPVGLGSASLQRDCN